MIFLDFPPKQEKEIVLSPEEQVSLEESISRAKKIFAMIDQEELKKVFADVIQKTDAPHIRYQTDVMPNAPFPTTPEYATTVHSLIEQRFQNLDKITFVAQHKVDKKSVAHVTPFDTQMVIAPQNLSSENFNNELLSTYVHELTHRLALTATRGQDDKYVYKEMGTRRRHWDRESYVEDISKGLTDEYKQKLSSVIGLIKGLDEALTEYIADSITNEYIRRTGTRLLFEDKNKGELVGYGVERVDLHMFIEYLGEITGFDNELVTQALVRTYFENNKLLDLSRLEGASKQEKEELIDLWFTLVRYIHYEIAETLEKRKAERGQQDNVEKETEGLQPKSVQQERYWVKALFHLDQYKKNEPEGEVGTDEK